MRSLILIAATLAAVCAGAGTAAAETFCVDHVVANCPSGSNTTHVDDLNAAFVAAAATTAPDTVSIGAGTYDSLDNSDQSYSANTTNPLTIVGAGRDQTTLTTTSASTPWVLSIGGPAGNAELSGVTVTGQGDVGHVLEANGVDIHDVAVTGNSDDNSVAVQLSFSNLRRSIVTSEGGSSVESTAGSGNIIEDSTLSGAERGLYLRPGSTATDIHRVTVNANTPLYVDNTSASIDDALLLAHESFGTTLAVLVDGTSTGAILNAHNVTVVNQGGGGLEVRGFYVFGDGPHHATLSLDNSIVRGFQKSVELADSGAPTTVTFTDSDSPFGAGVTGTAIPDDPKFVDPAGGDYRLRSDSSLIDRSTMDPPAGGSQTDLDGNPRVINDEVDLGAYEYQRRAPTAAAAAPATAFTGQAVAFTGSGTDPDHGDVLTYSWAFDDGASATGAAPSHSFAAPGHHVATLTVTDPIGLSATASAAVDVSVAPVVDPPVVDPPVEPPVEPPVVPPCDNPITGDGRANVLTGTPLGDLLRGLGGRDRLSGGAGADCLEGGRGNDRLKGGGGADKLSGGSGNDRLDGGRGKDSYSGGSGRDRIAARDGVAETVNCGSGRDRARVDRSDTVRRCESVKRR